MENELMNELSELPAEESADQTADEVSEVISEEEVDIPEDTGTAEEAEETDIPAPPEEEEAAEASDERYAALEAEISSLRERVEAAERTAREISSGWRELCELYPDADVSDMPDSFNEAIERGVPPAAAYALEMRRREVTRNRIEEATRRSRDRSAGRIREAEDTLYSPDEVRAMSQREVRQNIEKIRRSMKSWR